jgi:hypothetical protein
LSGNADTATTATNATNLTGTSTSNIQTSALATGTANSTTYLRGDRTWATVSGGSVTPQLRSKFLTSGTTYTPASDVAAFYVQIYGSTGGKSATNRGGIGGPGYSEKLFSSASGSYTYAIGAGGTNTGTDGGTTTFDVGMSVTGSAGVTTTAGGAGGVGSGGDFNANGGAGGDYGFSFGGAGGAGSRAGDGGTGSVNGGSSGNGGTGGNNASGGTPGVGAAAPSGSALVMPWNTSETFFGGSGSTTASVTGGAFGAPILNGSMMNLYGEYLNLFTSTRYGFAIPTPNGAGFGQIFYPFALSADGARFGVPGLIVIIEVLK